MHESGARCAAASPSRQPHPLLWVPAGAALRRQPPSPVPSRDLFIQQQLPGAFPSPLATLGRLICIAPPRRAGPGQWGAGPAWRRGCLSLSLGPAIATGLHQARGASPASPQPVSARGRTQVNGGPGRPSSFLPRGECASARCWRGRGAPLCAHHGSSPPRSFLFQPSPSIRTISLA